MKKRIRIMKTFFVALMLIPLTIVNAATKTETLVERLKELAKSFNGNVTYEYDTIDIDWTNPNSQNNEVSFSYKDNVIEYNPGKIENYEEAVEVTSHTMYSLYLIEAALRLNGYTEKEIEDYFSSETSEFNYERNGIELKEIGEDQEFTSSDGTSTITVAPRLIKIDVAKANLNTTDEAVTPKSTTINDIVEFLNNDSEFKSTEDEGKVIFENEVSSDEDTITISHTYYWDDYYNVSFPCENDILTYEDEDINSYYDAERAGSHHMFAMQILAEALKMNGYTTEQVQSFLSSENNDVTYEKNGIEIKEIGEEKEFTSPDGLSKITTTPMSIKIDLNRVRINESSYKVLDGANQIISANKELTFRFNIEFAKFKAEGKVYVDGKLVDPSNYTAKEGSTVITFNADYVKKLSANEHTLKVTTNDGEVETKFTITNNPQTGDSIIFFISLLGLSIIGLISGLYMKKRFN